MTPLNRPQFITPATGRSLVTQFGLLCLAGTLGFTDSRAQSLDALRNVLSENARSRGLGSMVQGLAGFGAVPGISGANFDVDSTGSVTDSDLSRMNFPLAHDFKQVGGLKQDLHSQFIQFDGPTSAKLFGRPLRWIGFAANSTFVGDAADGLGFDYFFELGGGIELVEPNILQGVEGFSVRGSALIGNGVTGWSLGAQLEF